MLKILSVLILVTIAIPAFAKPPPKPPTEGNPYPQWDQRLPSDDGDVLTGCDSSRFKCIFDDEAVRDEETGLVWQLVPFGGGRMWDEAHDECLSVTTGGRFGWRLPSIYELRSLQQPPDPDVEPVDLLPLGHPFLNISNDAYWSSTKRTDGTTAYALRFVHGSPCSFGTLCGLDARSLSGDQAQVWCVRGHSTH